MKAGDLIKWGLLGLAGWWVYETFFNTTTAAAPAATSTTAAPAATTTATTTTAPSSAGTLNALYNQMVALAKAGGASNGVTTDASGNLNATGYVWNYYLTQANSGVTPTMDAAANGSTTYTSAAYWALVGPAVGAALGLSGYRLGLAGLGAALMRGRR
jgi:hypothetical protein